jgi:hypothetical protein
VEKPEHPLFRDIEGMKFGRLKAISYHGYKVLNNKKIHLWVFDCDCGNRIIAKSIGMASGRKRSCGCMLKDVVHAASKTHGMKNTPEYNTWRAMRSRCNNPNRPEYKNYGGRGIKVCKEWDESFESFIGDMGKKPSGKYSLERIDNDLGYFKENCKWATYKEQASNRRPKNRNYL